ncbi:MAG: hypothetical protein E6H09_17485 [Bacteroidetes bacterium]|jgi:hypothetical protein|nr:MAG: hypothetical protein E6H09_17485 [Bacteroidota bacterium]
MKKSPNIASVETKTGFHERQIETFVKNNLPPKLFLSNKLVGMGNFADTHNDIECCAAELPVNGLVEFFLNVENSGSLRRIGYPVISRFIVFCTREEMEDYKVTWICSLS